MTHLNEIWMSHYVNVFGRGRGSTCHVKVPQRSHIMVTQGLQIRHRMPLYETSRVNNQRSYFLCSKFSFETLRIEFIKNDHRNGILFHGKNRKNSTLYFLQ